VRNRVRNAMSPAIEPRKPTLGCQCWPILALLLAIVVVYFRIFSAGFVGFDDDIHVYANPFLNPPTLQSVARLWQQPYESSTSRWPIRSTPSSRTLLKFRRTRTHPLAMPLA
jgi:hypothetical protein